MCVTAHRSITRRLSISNTECYSMPVAAKPSEDNSMGVGTILLAILVLALLGVIPAWPHSRQWGYGPSGGIGLIRVIVLILFRLGSTARLASPHRPLQTSSSGSPVATLSASCFTPFQGLNMKPDRSRATKPHRSCVTNTTFFTHLLLRPTGRRLNYCRAMRQGV